MVRIPALLAFFFFFYLKRCFMLVIEVLGLKDVYSSKNNRGQKKSMTSVPSGATDLELLVLLY